MYVRIKNGGRKKRNIIVEKRRKKINIDLRRETSTRRRRYDLSQKFFSPRLRVTSAIYSNAGV